MQAEKNVFIKDNNVTFYNDDDHLISSHFNKLFVILSLSIKEISKLFEPQGLFYLVSDSSIIFTLCYYVFYYLSIH